ncbi:MAG TPA: C25 family cysteine peptidase, partial [Bacteroidia bacterium]|nr:C25 family cysteine peptidase [Bacteroidia bacterium]
WRNWVSFIADDEDYQTHLTDADALANKVKVNHPEYNIDKIYSDAYLQYSSPGGQRYYDVNTAIDQRIAKGCLVINYTGHGGEGGLGHERYLEIGQIQSYTNKCNMPLFITAT